MSKYMSLEGRERVREKIRCKSMQKSTKKVGNIRHNLRRYKGKMMI
jgi:hypothetical protein